MRTNFVAFLIFWQISQGFGLLWTLFGLGCNCCQCPATSPPIMPNLFHPLPILPYPRPSIPPPPPQNQAPLKNYEDSPTSQFPGPPASAPINREQLNELEELTELRYSTSQIILPPTTTSTPILNSMDILKKLEEEIALEKYRLFSKKQRKKNKNKKKQKKLRVFTYQHRGNQQGMKAVIRPDPKTSISTNSDIFLPIEIGVQDDLANEEPAGPPPNVRNKISHDNDVIHRRFMLT